MAADMAADFGQIVFSVGSRARMHSVMPEETSEHGARRGTHQWCVGRSTCGARAAELAKNAMRQRPFAAILMSWLGWLRRFTAVQPEGTGSRSRAMLCAEG